MALTIFQSLASQGRGFGWMRVYIGLSFTLMAAPFAWSFFSTDLEVVRTYLPQVEVLGQYQSNYEASIATTSWPLRIYLLGCAVFLALFLRSVWLGLWLFTLGTWDSKARVYWLKEDLPPCSFFGKVFLPSNKVLDETVLLHERTHVRKWHF
jgi:hypothetical protein